MLDTSVTFSKRESQGFEALPADVYQVELLDVKSEERPTYDTRNKPAGEQELETVLNFQFTLLEGELRGRNVWANFVPTFFYVSKKKGKNKLYRIVEALNAHELSPEEEATFSADALNALVGKQCRVVVEQKQAGDKTYSNITNFMPIRTELTRLTTEERAKAQVKKKDEPTGEGMVVEGDPNYVDPDKIPF